MTNLIKAFCPSRNRAHQLSVLLSSTEKNCPNTYSWYILYDYSTEEFKKGYEQLFRMIKKYNYPVERANIHFVKETNCCQDFRTFLNSLTKDNPYFSLFVDDCIFFRRLDSSPEEFASIFEDHPEVWIITCREGLNGYQHGYLPWAPIIQPPLKVEEELFDGKYIKWNCLDYDRGLNQGFFVGFDSILYRTEEFKEMYGDLRINNLRDVEHNINTGDNKQKYCGKRPYKVSPKLSCVVSANYNSTHLQPGGCGYLVSCSAEEFNKRFLDGEIMAWEDMNLCELVKGCHGEYPLKFRKIKESKIQ